MNELIKSNLIYGNQYISTYSRNNENIGIHPIDEFGLIVINNLIKNVPKIINLSVIPYAINIKSLCGYEGTTVNASIKLTIKQSNTPIVQLNLSDNILPYAFPENCINPSICELEFLANENISILHMFYKQAYLIDSFTF